VAGDTSLLLRAALSLAVTVIILLIGAWAVDLNRRVESLAERVRIIERHAAREDCRWPPHQ
jgi:hypothetical protein